jgi:alpha-mannosidase/mannosylglycerate hydrolase
MLGDGLDVPVTQSTLAAYIKTLRQTFPDNMRPAVKGELRLQGLREHSYLLPGTLSSRLYLKQAHAAMQARLTYAAEPLLAIALTHGKIIYPDNLRALLDHSWRTLLKNQAKSALGGAGSDAVHAENEVRYRQIEDSSTAVINGALRALPGELHMGNPPPATSVNETYVVLWNPHSWAITQFVEVRLDLPAGMSPNRLISPKGEEQIFGWSPDNQTISFLGEAPSVGYATYTVQLADRPPDELHLAKITLGNIIAKVSGDTLRVEDQQLVWHRDGQVLSDLLNFYDGGDAGDAYNYSPPSPNVIVQAQLEGDVKVEKAALYERMILRHRMRLATGLRADRGRERGLKLLELTTTATLYDAVPGIHFHTTFENTASDHRLRAHLRTGIAADMVLADSAFGIVARKVSIEGHEIETRPNREAVLSTYPMHNSCAVESGEGNSRAMALLARGLPEFQAIPEGSQTTLALTLLRAVGWLSRGDLKTRTASLAPMIATPGAQCERRMSADYALVALPAGDPVALLRAGQAFGAPLHAYQYRQPPETRRQSYLALASYSVLMTALKPPQTGKGWIVRLLNPTTQPAEASLAPYRRLVAARLVTLAEEAQSDIVIDQGTLTVKLDPYKIVTLHLEFE